MAETTKQRTDRLMGMSHGQLVMHCQDLTRQRDLAVDAYHKYIETEKCDDKQGQIARLSHEFAQLKSAIEAMRTAGGSAEFQAAFDRAKALIA